jgi:uncharacterized membrane protein
MTVVVVLIGFLVMVTGLIEYLFMGYLAYLLILIVLSVFLVFGYVSIRKMINRYVMKKENQDEIKFYSIIRVSNKNLLQ